MCCSAGEYIEIPHAIVSLVIIAFIQRDNPTGYVLSAIFQLNSTVCMQLVMFCPGFRDLLTSVVSINPDTFKGHNPGLATTTVLLDLRFNNTIQVELYHSYVPSHRPCVIVTTFTVVLR